MTNPSAVNSRQLIFLFILCTLLISPALFAGFMGDDYMHMALLKPGLPVSPPADASIFGLFSFMDANPERNVELMGLGLIPWWTFPEMKYAFWRPISELTHGLDHFLWSGNAILMHLHNIAWYLVLCFLVLKLYRSQYKQLPSKLLLIGFALYLLDGSHGFTLSWIANRNGLIAATFGLASILTYIRYREQQSLPLLVSSLAFLALALLSAEIGISAMGYIGAYALFLDRKGWFKGCLAVIPHGILVITWWLAYKYLGFGAENADAYYLDPVASPLLFLSTLGQRLIVLFGSQWGLIPAEIFGFSGDNKGLANIVFAVAAFFFLIVIIALAPQIKRSDKARFWLFGAIFSALPVCSALPHDRLLLFIGVGAIGIIIDLLNHGWLEFSKGNITGNPTLFAGHSKPIKGFLFTFFALHLVISPLALPLMAYSPKVWASQIDISPSNFDFISDVKSKKLVLFNVPIGSSMAIAIWKYNKGEDLPERIWPISNKRSQIKITRLTENKLLIEKEGGFVQRQEEVVRNIATQPFSVDDSIDLGGLTIKVTSTNKNHQPATIEATFKNSLDSADLIFLSWDTETGRYINIDLPSIGKSIKID